MGEVEGVLVDQGYSEAYFARAVKQVCKARVEVIKRTSQEFEVLSKRWIVEHTFGWLNCLLPSTEEALSSFGVGFASISLTRTQVT